MDDTLGLTSLEFIMVIGTYILMLCSVAWWFLKSKKKEKSNEEAQKLRD